MYALILVFAILSPARYRLVLPLKPLPNLEL